jgi:hypothetical protein
MVGKVWKVLVLGAAAVAVSCGGTAASPTPNPPSPLPPGGPPRALDSVTITISAQGFRLDSAAAAFFTLETLRVFQGSRLTFVNQNTVAHDIQSGPPHLHTDCPEIGGAGFLVPGQTKSTDPLNRLVSCTFHDHHYETDPRFSGRVVVEAR